MHNIATCTRTEIHSVPPLFSPFPLLSLLPSLRRRMAPGMRSSLSALSASATTTAAGLTLDPR
eukprot:1416881-Rhodomonas_salina.2